MIRQLRQISLLALAFSPAFAPLLTTNAAWAAGEPTMVATTAHGPILTDTKGMTLYTFDKDMGGKSACNGGCATIWPPLMAGGEAKPMGSYTVITRDDGAKQWAYMGKPLYVWSKDAKAGDMGGDGFNSVWHVAKP